MPYGHLTQTTIRSARRATSEATVDLRRRRTWRGEGEGDAGGERQNEQQGDQQGDGKYNPKDLDEARRIIDALNKRIRDLERGTGADAPPAPGERRRVLLVGVGDDAMLQEDLAQLRRVQAQTNIRISRLLPVSKASLERTIERHRAAGTPVKLLHLAVHSGPQGLLFSDGMADGVWLSQHLSGVEIAVLAGCSNDTVADFLRVVPAVVSMREEVDNRDASIFAGAFWLAVGQGMDANEAFERALQRAPTLVGEFVELHL